MFSRSLNLLCSEIVNRFLLAKLISDDLVNRVSIRKMRQALENFSGELDDALESTVRRINGQPKDARDLAHRLIRWIVNAERPLRTSEITHAFAIEPEDEEVNTEELAISSTLLRICMGVVVCDSNHEILTLMHPSAYEFFSSYHGDAADAHEDIARTCFTYLSLRTLRFGPCVRLDDLENRFKHLPFLSYAAHHWGIHASFEGLEEKLKDIIVELLSDTGLRESSVQALQYRPSIRSRNIAAALFKSTPQQVSPLHVTSCWGLTLTMSRLLQTGEPVDSRDSQQQTPLHWAASTGNFKTAEILLENGADAYASDCHEWTPYSKAMFTGHLRLMRLIAGSGAPPLPSQEGRNTEVLLVRGLRATIDGSRFVSGKDHLARSRPARGPSDLDMSAGFSGSRVFYAFGAIDWRREQLRLENKWSIDHPRPAPSTLWKVLIRRKMINPQEEQDNPGEMILHFALETENANWKNELLYSAIEHGRVSVLNLLLETGAVANHRVKSQTMLHFAAAKTNPGCVKTLLEFGAEHSSKDCYGQTALHEAVLSGLEVTIEALLESGANVNEKRDLGDNNAEGLYQSGQSPLMLACGYDRKTKEDYERQSRIIELLLRHGANPSIEDAEGRTSLHYSCICGHIDLARNCILSGADINGQDKQGTSALHLAVFNHHAQLVKILLEAGANAQLVDICGRSAVNYLAEGDPSGGSGGQHRKEVYQDAVEASKGRHRANQNTPELNCVKNIFDEVHAYQKPSLLNVEYDLLQYNPSGLPLTLRWHTALSMAMSRGNWQLFETLRASKARLPKEFSALLLQPIMACHLPALRFLADNGAKVDDNAKIVSILQYMIVNEGGSIQARKFDQMLEILTTIGFDVNGLDGKSGKTLVAIAALNVYSQDVAEALLHNGADLFHPNIAEDVLLVAALQSNLQFLKAVLAFSGLQIPMGHWLQNRTHCSIAVPNILECICNCLQLADKLNAPIGPSRDSPLIEAVEVGNKALVNQLITCGANTETGDDCRWRPLHLASFQGNESLVRILIGQGRVEVDAKTSLWRSNNERPSCLSVGQEWKGTALHLATMSGNVKIVSLLLRHGATPDATFTFEPQGPSIHLPKNAYWNQLCKSDAPSRSTALAVALGTGGYYGVRVANLGRERLEIARILIEQGASTDHIAYHLGADARKFFTGFEDVWRHIKSDD